MTDNDKVIVEYDYMAKEPDELTIRKGDIITDVVKKQGGWWEGVLKDKKGMFPDNFVRPLDKDSSVVLRNQKDVTRIRQCRVIFSYNQDHEDELNLKVGDVIDIVGEEEEGWWKGALKGKIGVFPSNFVKEISWEPSPSIRVSNNLENGNESKPPKLPAKPSKQLCEATFPYKAQNEDELSFQEGDLITITNKECPDPGWWHGELNGKTGVFPDNFVVLIDNRNSNKEVRKSIGDKGAIKSVSVASQRKSLEPKRESVDSISLESNKPALISNKPFTSVKKSPSNSGLGFLSDLKKKIEDVVDGSIGSKHVSVTEETFKSNDNAFDHVERSSLLTDLRATRAKAPGRRPPTTSHKDEVPSEEGENTNPNVQHSEEQPVYSSVKPRLREWEKHKAPWLEEMKKNQVKRTLISALEENSSEIESNLKVEAPKVHHEAKSPHESKSPHEAKSPYEAKSPHEAKLPREAKSPIDSDKLNHEPTKHSIADNVKDIPESRNRTSYRESLSISPAAEPRRENFAYVLERLDRLEETVQKQNQTIEELQNKLQLEIDLRIFLQEKLHKLHA
ncbi:unnamed protein product [Psylliodes chrysocephalus]|uniref:SH3 domain-containing protein n=1 Tax=Psylliodes chrysocephalus TaxID=3402493 RepID=A0A9P0G6B1_9CUCU|nr:unnamed protein product [Psylliodes chrysocephala]